MSGERLVVGVGNSWRGDDAAGLEVARRLSAATPKGVRVVEYEGECSGLVELMRGASEVAIVDAARSDAPAGTVHRLDPGSDSLPRGSLRSSTHAFGVAEALELARSLDRLPPGVCVYAVEGRDFAVGEGLTPEVEQAVDELVRELADAARK